MGASEGAVVDCGFGFVQADTSRANETTEETADHIPGPKKMIEYIDATTDCEVEDGEWRELSEFFPTRWDDSRKYFVHYDNRLSREPRVRHANKAGMKLPCQCGSGKKYKTCCLIKDAKHASAQAS